MTLSSGAPAKNVQNDASSAVRYALYFSCAALTDCSTRRFIIDEYEIEAA